MITIPGAGGAVGNEFFKPRATRNRTFRLVGRNPWKTPGAVEHSPPISRFKDQTIRAVATSFL